MKFLLDQGLPRLTVAELLARGFDAVHVSQLGMAKASDEDILGEARSRNAVVVTLDSDFHSLLASDHATTPSTIRIRIEGLKGNDVAELIEQVAAAAGADLEAGAVVSVTKTGIRVRLLPLV
ncbi:MAG: DUF5615 family PIN-like protein [Planctomycetota bacterium]